MVGSLNRSKKYVAFSAVFYRYKSQIRSIKATLNVAIMLCTLHPWMSQKSFTQSDESNIFTQVMTFSIPRRQGSRFFIVISMANVHQSNHQNSLSIPFVRRKFHSDSISPRTAAVWEKSLSFKCSNIYSSVTSPTSLLPPCSTRKNQILHRFYSLEPWRNGRDSRLNTSLDTKISTCSSQKSIIVYSLWHYNPCFITPNFFIHIVQFIPFHFNSKAFLREDFLAPYGWILVWRFRNIKSC